MTFLGWPPEALGVLETLDGDPSPVQREAVRPDRERLVRAPMVALLHDLAQRNPAYVDHSVWRYATTTWWWQHQSATIRIDRNVEIGLGFDLDGLRVQGGWWFGGADQRERYRDAVAGRGGARLERIVDDLRARSFEITGDVMVRVPRGYPASHRRATLLRHRSLLAVRRLDLDDGLHDASALGRVEAILAELRPMLEWLADHVSSGPPGL